jgi:hypothetical protein
MREEIKWVSAKRLSCRRDISLTVIIFGQLRSPDFLEIVSPVEFISYAIVFYYAANSPARPVVEISTMDLSELKSKPVCD